MSSTPDPAKYESPDEIAAHIDRLMEEAEAMLSGPVSGHVVSQLTDLKFRLTEAQEKIVELYGTAQRKVVEGARTIDTVIRRHPYEAVILALGAGVLIGKLMVRRRDRG